MPQFHWTGIDLSGKSCKGTLSCPNIEALETILSQQEIALVKARATKKRWLKKWTRTDSLIFFSSLHELLQAGLFLPDALEVIHSNESHARRKEVIEEIAHQIATGASLSQALITQSVFKQLDQSLTHAGQESGQLTAALGLLTDHYEFEQSFYQRLRKALVMPIISIGFFIVVFAFILFGLLPKMATLFQQQQLQLPPFTRILLRASNAGSEIAIFCTSMVIIGLSFQWLRVTKPMLAHRTVLKIPLVGRFARQRALVSFFKTLALLVNGNISLVTAISLAQQSINNLALRTDIDYVITEISKGESLSKALAQVPWAQESITMISLGEQTGKLAPVIGRVAAFYEQRFNSALDRIVLAVQPTLIILMGICIAGLICAVYVPIISLAGTIKL